jgi:hypothetical protein
MLRHWRDNREAIDFTCLFEQPDDAVKKKNEPEGVGLGGGLAIVLRPILEAKIEQLQAGVDIPVPPIVQIIREAYSQAEYRRDSPFTLTGATDILDEE